MSDQEDTGTPVTEIVDMAHVDELFNSVQVVLDSSNPEIIFPEDGECSSIDSEVRRLLNGMSALSANSSYSEWRPCRLNLDG